MSRFQLKQFAQDASNNGVFGSYQTGNPTLSNDPEILQSLEAYKNGWLDATTQATKLPRLEEMQGLQYLICKAVKELYSEGIPQWLSTETYQKNSFCVYDGTLYKNITGTYTADNPAIDTTNWTKAQSGSSLIIGQLVPALVPLLDSRVHLLDGSLISQIGVYSAFSTYLKSLQTGYPNLFCTETQWQGSVTTYGQCSKFVIDDTNETIRLPLIKEYIKGVGSLSDLGSLQECGLPNITGTIATLSEGNFDNSNTNGAFSVDTTSTKSRYAYAKNAGNYYRANFNASISNNIYGRTTNTVEVNSAKCAYYIVLATVAKTDIEVNIDNVVNDLDSKADKDLSKLTATGKEVVSNLPMPSNRFVDLVFTAEKLYTAPANGYVYLIMEGSGDVALFNRGSAGSSNSLIGVRSTSTLNSAVYIPCKKGDVINYVYTQSTCLAFRFIYAEGN